MDNIVINVNEIPDEINIDTIEMPDNVIVNVAEIQDNITVNTIEVPDEITINITEIDDNIQVNISTNTVWGMITGILSNQTDLQNALDAKADKIITITGTGLLAGQGGDLSANRIFALNNGDIDHDLLLNFIGNEHINHNSVIISGAGLLAGQGGDITLSRTFTLNNIDIDHNGLTNTHNLTTDIDHDQLLNAVGLANSHTQIDSHIADLTIHFTEASLNLPTTYLRLDTANDPLTGTLNCQTLDPSANAIYDLGSTNRFRTLYLDNNGGKVLDCSTAIGTTARTNFIFDLGGGGNVATEGGDFIFQMDPCVGACENNIVFDVGNVYWAGANFFNRFKIQSFTGLRTYAFTAAFGGFNNFDYGWELQYISGLANIAKTLFFDNQSASGITRSIDFRIGTINKLTIENDGTIIVIDRITTPELTAGVINNGFNIGTVAVPGVSLTAFGNFFGLNWFDYLTINAVTTNLPVCLGMFPNGTAVNSYVNVYNSSNTGATAWLEMGVRGAFAELVVRDFAQTTNITALNIGSGGNDFPVFDVTCTTLTDINFIFAGITELTIQPDTLIFGNNAQLDWSTNDLLLDCGVNNTLELVETVWKDINIGGVNLTKSVANQPGQVTIDVTSIITYAFDGINFIEELSGAFELQHDYKEGTDIIPHVHWYPTTAGAGNVKWQLEYWIRIDNTVKQTGIITITDAASGTAWTEERADFPVITGTNLKINAQIHFRLFRDPNDAADTYGADAAVGTLGIHYEINTMGSRQTLVK